MRCPRLIIGRMIDPQSDMVAWLAGQDEPTVILLSGGRVGASVLELKFLWPSLATFSREAVVEYLGYCGSGIQTRPEPPTTSQRMYPLRCWARGCRSPIYWSGIRWAA